MSVSVNLRNAVAEHNIEDIRGGLWACIAVDPNMTGKFKESLDYVLTNGISKNELFDNDDGESFSTEPTEENFNELGGMIRSNFSKKKIEALCKIGRVLYPPRSSNTEEIRRENVSSENGSGPQQNHQTSNTTATIGGAVLGAAAGVLIGKIAIGGAAAILGGLAIGAAVGATVGTMFSKK